LRQSNIFFSGNNSAAESLPISSFPLNSEELLYSNFVKKKVRNIFYYKYTLCYKYIKLLVLVDTILFIHLFLFMFIKLTKSNSSCFLILELMKLDFKTHTLKSLKECLMGILF